jgi:hypothetical protein
MPLRPFPRTPSQRRAAQRLARLGRSLLPRAAGRDHALPRRAALPRRPVGPRPPARFDARLEGFGPSASGWELSLPDFDLPTPPWLAAPLPGAVLQFPRLGPESLADD